MPPPAQPITRREQIELDELLGDIYRGIETLPNRSQVRPGLIADNSYDIVKTEPGRGTSSSNQNRSTRVIGQAHVREYELPESSPFVQRHKQEVAALRQQQHQTNYLDEDPYGRRSNLRYASQGAATGGADSGGVRQDGSASGRNQRQQQSLAAFMHENPVGSVTPDQKRRVRIVDPPPSRGRARGEQDQFDDDYLARDFYNEALSANKLGGAKQRKHFGKEKERVKYVNTNKFLYHQERNPDDEQLDDLSDLENQDGSILRPGEYGEADDDIDGVTRVEYYHTSWLDRQLGRASKRRSSKELNERQAKEKAMIEELKRNLKNGAITLRQSFKGKRGQNQKTTKPSSDLFVDDQFLSTTSNYGTSTKRQQTDPLRGRHNNNSHHHNPHQDQRIKDSPHRVISSGLVTVPRKYNSNNRGVSKPIYSEQTTVKENQFEQVERNVPNHTNYKTTNPVQKPFVESLRMSDYNNFASPQNNHLSTLPSKTEGRHQLLQSHYRGNLRDKTNTLPHLHSPRPSPVQPAAASQIYSNQPALTSSPSASDMTKFTGYTKTQGNINNNNGCVTNQHSGAKSPIQQQIQASNTISGIPSATEVVRSALSRSGSQVSLNQLNKTINLLPNSPPGPSPMTPTQQLKAASPSLSPSPIPQHYPTASPALSSGHHYQSKTLGHRPTSSGNQYLPGQVVVHGTRTVGRPPQQQQQHQQALSNQSQHQQQVYASPHTAFMQHRMEQQMKQPNRNVSSIREFNELDSLLRSLSPGVPSTQTRPTQHNYSSIQVQVAPGFSNNPTQPSFGLYKPTSTQQNSSSPAPKTYGGVTYAQVQKQPQQQQQQQQKGPGLIGTPQTHTQPFTIDVTDKKFDENCRQRQNEGLSEFEAPIELVPAMEDYQNISKLNPVKNHYWYKPNMSRDRAIELLKDKPQGTFIVRDSTSFGGAYGLALKVSKLPKNILASLRNSNGDQSAEFIRHFLIEPTGSGVRLRGYANEPVFDSLPDLIYQHSLTELALPCKLIIPRADIEDPRFNQKQKQFFDDFVASKEHAKHQPYERTSPDGGYRRYPGDVYVHNEHRIIFQ